MPHAYDLECSLLGALMLDPRTFADLSPHITEDLFHDPRNRAVYRAMEKLSEPDMILVENYLREKDQLESIGGALYITELTRQSGGNLDFYLAVLVEKRIKRELIKVGSLISERSYNGDDSYEVLEQATRMLSEVDKRSGGKNSLTPTEIFEREKNTPTAEKLEMGVYELDQGIYANTNKKGQIEITIADSGHGKTNYALYKCAQLMRKGRKVAWFQLEDTDVNTADYFKLNIPEHQDNIVICQNLYDIEEIKRECRYLKREFGLDYIVFDYVQNIDAKKKERSGQVEYISTQITRLAKEIQVVCHPLSQITINYGTRHGWAQEPNYGDVRWSQQLKQDAHIITSVFRPSKIESLISDNTAFVVDWKNQQVPFDSVFVRQCKVRYGKQDWRRFHMIHTEKGLQAYAKGHNEPHNHFNEQPVF